MTRDGKKKANSWHGEIVEFTPLTLGALFGLIALLAFLELTGILQGAWRNLWPIVLLITGLIVAFRALIATYRIDATTLKQPIKSLRFQAVKVALLFITAGATEIVALATSMYAWRLLWVLVLLYLGRQFRIGSKDIVDARTSRLIGGSLILAGMARTIAILSGIYKGTVGVAWIALLFYVAFLLLMSQYRVSSQQQ